MKKFKMIGKDVLGKRGFCLSPNKMIDENGHDCFFAQYKKVREQMENNYPIMVTNMTELSVLKELDYNYIPSIVRYHPYNKLTPMTMFDPDIGYGFAKNGLDALMPKSDFIIWDKTEEVNVMTYSRTAPVLYFETYDGQCCLGVVLRKSLMLHGEFLFERILKLLGATNNNKAYLGILSCTSRQYDDMEPNNILEYIEMLAGKFNVIADVETFYVTEANTDVCYNAEESGNHVIVVY